VYNISGTDYLTCINTNDVVYSVRTPLYPVQGRKLKKKKRVVRQKNKNNRLKKYLKNNNNTVERTAVKISSV